MNIFHLNIVNSYKHVTQSWYRMILNNFSDQVDPPTTQNEPVLSDYV